MFLAFPHGGHGHPQPPDLLSSHPRGPFSHSTWPGCWLKHRFIALTSSEVPGRFALPCEATPPHLLSPLMAQTGCMGFVQGTGQRDKVPRPECQLCRPLHMGPSLGPCCHTHCRGPPFGSPTQCAWRDAKTGGWLAYCLSLSTLPQGVGTEGVFFLVMFPST